MQDRLGIHVKVGLIVRQIEQGERDRGYEVHEVEVQWSLRALKSIERLTRLALSVGFNSGWLGGSVVGIQESWSFKQIGRWDQLGHNCKRLVVLTCSGIPTDWSDHAH